MRVAGVSAIPTEAVPKQTTISGQPHMLAYINPQEAQLVAELKANNKGGDDNYDLKANQPVDKILTHYNQRLGGYGKDYGGANATKYLTIK